MNQASTGSARVSRSFVMVVAALTAVLVFVGFAPTYYLKGLFEAPALGTYAHVHGLIFSTWVIVFLAQTMLVAQRRIAWHRRLGSAAAVLVAAMLVSGLYTAITSAQRGHSPIPAIPPLAFLAVPVFDIVIFAILAGAGLVLRRRTDAHRRFMTLATIAILSPAIARLPFEFIRAYGPLAFFTLEDLFLVACFVYDWRTERRIHWATITGALLIVVSQPSRLVVAQTDAWMAFAGWLTGTG